MAGERYAKVFQALAARGEGAFVPFAVLGDPDPETSLAVLEAFAAGGADALELGIPFSDPIADGPAIQGADLRALRAGVTPAVALEVLAAFRARHPELPIGLLLYANLVQRPGARAFCRRLAAAGADSVLIADLPLEEREPFQRRGPGSRPRAGVDGDAPHAQPSAWQPSPPAAGPTSTWSAARASPARTRAWPIRPGRCSLASGARVAIPTLLGFGIGTPAQVRQAIAAGATGAISGSAAVEIIARHARAHPEGLRNGAGHALAAELAAFVAAMKAGTPARWPVMQGGSAA